MTPDGWRDGRAARVKELRTREQLRHLWNLPS